MWFRTTIKNQYVKTAQESTNTSVHLYAKMGFKIFLCRTTYAFSMLEKVSGLVQVQFDL
jgi:hypothetical protein